MSGKILILGTFDSKGSEFAFLYLEIMKNYDNIMTMNTGFRGTTKLFPVDISAEEVIKAGGGDLPLLGGNRGPALQAMSEGAQKYVDCLYKSGEIAGVIGMGGGRGTAIASIAMRNLPVGFPKVCISTVASGDTSAYVGTKDIVLFPSIVDIRGINMVSRKIIPWPRALSAGW